jgi:hypothetical protein
VHWGTRWDVSVGGLAGSSGGWGVRWDVSSGHGGRGNANPHHGGADGRDEQSLRAGVGGVHGVFAFCGPRPWMGRSHKAVGDALEDSWRILGGQEPVLSAPRGQSHHCAKMHRYNPAILLYASLRTAIVEDADSATWFTVDQPSTRFGSFNTPQITKVGLELDHKLAALLEHLDAPVPRADRALTETYRSAGRKTSIRTEGIPLRHRHFQPGAGQVFVERIL